MVFASRSTAARRLAPWLGATTADAWGLTLLALIYVKIYMSFNPFTHGEREIDASGSVVNRVFWLGILGFAGVVIWRNWTTAIALLRRVWPIGLPILWFALTLLWTGDAALTTRRVFLIACMAGVAFGVASARPSPSDFLKVSLLVLGAILLFNVLSILAVPHLARPRGAFLGIYEAKNTAGAVAAVFFVFWFFAILWAQQFEIKILCLFGTLAALFFLIGTVSKTSIGAAAVTPLLGIGLYYVLRLDPIWRVIAYAAFLIFACVLAWLILFYDLTLEELGIIIFEDLTFTNRTEVWGYVWRSIEERYWLGHGYGAFWYVGGGVANLLSAERGFASVTTSAHNGYLNIWLEAGLVGLIFCGLTFVLAVRGALQLLRNPDVPAFDRWVYALVLVQVVLLLLRDLMEASLYRPHSATALMFFLLYFLIALWQWEGQGVHEPTLRAHQRPSSRY